MREIYPDPEFTALHTYILPSVLFKSGYPGRRKLRLIYKEHPIHVMAPGASGCPRERQPDTTAPSALALWPSSARGASFQLRSLRTCGADECQHSHEHFFTQKSEARPPPSGEINKSSVHSNGRSAGIQTLQAKIWSILYAFNALLTAECRSLSTR